MSERQIEIVNAKQLDIADLVGIYSEFFAEEGIRTEREKVEENLLFFLNDDRSVVFAGLVESKIVAIASASISFGVEFGWAAEMEDIYVVPGLRGSGAAPPLLSIYAESCLPGSELF